ncbi:MAG: DMT family transporter [Bauldia sp.]|nr:DMT family transporter [Bauldia sp.]
MATQDAPPILSATVAPAPVAIADAPAFDQAARAFRVGILFAAASALLFSTKGIVIKLAYAEGLDAETLMALRLGLALPVYLVIGALSIRDRRRTGRALPPRRQVVAACFVGILGYYVASYTDFLGLRYVSAQFERMILFTYPLLVVLFGAWFFGQKPQRSAIIAIGIAYCGLALMVMEKLGEAGGNLLLGTGFVLCSAVAFAFYQLLAKPLISSIGPRLFTCIAMSAAAAVALLQFVLSHPLSALAVTPTAFWYAVLLAVGATILPSFLLASALHRISAQVNSAIGMVSPAATILLAFLILGERLTVLDVIGTLLVIGAVGWMTFGGRKAAR